MKFLKFVFIFATIGTIILLTGCGHSAEEDKQRIVNWLNDTYGENTYTMEQNPKNKRYFIVVLHEYPELKFNTTVVRDVKRGTSYLWSDVDEVFCESAIQQFTKSNTISPDTLSYDEDIQYVYSTEASSLEELKTSYDKMISFITFVSEHYPSFRKVVRTHFDFHLVAGKNFDVVHTHLSRNMSGDFVSVL